MKAKYTVSEVHQRIGVPLAYARGSDQSRDRRKVRKDWLAGESACPTEAQALAQQRGTDAFVCQPGDLSDSRALSKGAFSRNTRPRLFLTALLGILLAGCSLRGKPAKSAIPPAAPKPVVMPEPAPPSPALSIPQTRVELPKPQPVDPAAFATGPKPPEPPEPPEPPPAAAPARPRRASQPAGQPATPAATATPPPEPRETFQEIVSPAEKKRLHDQALARRREANQILDQLGRRQLTGAEQNVAATIRNFLALSEQAEKHNDPRQADALAERAQILAKELQSGK